MISKVIRLGGIVSKQQMYQRVIFPSYSYKMSPLNVVPHYLFSQNKKSPITPHKPKPSNKPEDDDSINAQANPLDPMKSEQKPEQQDRGMEPTKFGNAMLIISAIALALAYLYMEIQVIRANKKKKPEAKAAAKVTGVGKAHIGGDWELVDTNGKPFSNKDLEGQYYLIYFGFTHCPDICPNSLTKLAKAVKKVKKSKQANFFNLKTVFVSVDPDRDSSQKLSKFVSLFDPDIIAVTGTNNQDPALRDCMKQFKIYASKLQYEQADTEVKGRKTYTIDHTILTYLMSDTNEYLAHLGGNLGEHDLATIIMDKIAEDKREKMKNLKI